MARCLGSGRRRAKAERLVESCGGWVRCSQAQDIKAAPSGLNDLGDQPSANSLPPVPGENVEMSNAPNALVSGIRIDVEATHSHQLPIGPRDEEPFAPPVESVRAVDPLIHEPTDESETGALTLGEQRLQRGER